MNEAQWNYLISILERIANALENIDGWLAQWQRERRR